jgi:RND family efflux transporter MFP subunit
MKDEERRRKMKKMRSGHPSVRVGALVFVGFAALGLAGGCRRPAGASGQGPGQEEGSAPSRAKVSVVHPQRKTVRRAIQRPGYNVEAYQSTALQARISGYVGKWYPGPSGKPFDIGDRVRRGQVLADLLVPEMEVEVQQKDAALKQAQAEVKQARAALLRAEADRDYRKSQYDRLSRVGKTGVIDKENVEEYRLALEAAKAALAKADADVAVAEARVGVAEKARDYSRTLLRYTRIRAPFDGVITKRHLSEGDYVQPAGRKAEALFVVDQLDPVRVVVHVPEAEAGWVRDKDEVAVRSLRGEVFEGEVTRTSRALDPATRTLRTEIELANREGKLSPGMYVDVTITPRRPDVWALPESAVVTTEGESFCYLLQDGKAVRTLLRVGLRGGGLVEVQKKRAKPTKGSASEAWEDVTGREEVIEGGVADLKDGQAVEASSGGK